MTVSIKDNIVYGGDINSQITKPHRSLGHFTLEKIKSNGNDIMLIDASTGHQYTKQEMYEKIFHMAYILQSLGVKNGDVVGVCAENCIEFAITLQATFALGATLAPFNITYTERELDHAANLSKPKIIFSSKGPLSKVLHVARTNKFITNVIVFGDTSPSSDAIPLTKLYNDKTIVRQTDFYCPSVDKNETIALIMCSSGTTGMPKGVQITQNNVLSTIDAHLAAKSSEEPGMHVLCVIPWFHVFGCVRLIIASCRDSVFVFLPKFEEKAFLRSIEEYKISIALMVPPLMLFLAKHPLVDDYDLSSLRILWSGAAPLRKETEEAIKKRLRIPYIRQGYGLSESTLSLLKQSDVYSKSGSVGGLAAGHWAKVVDPETGAILVPNQCGELCFKGPHIMKGYIGDKKSTRAMIRNGWLHTGDVGYYDDDFEFFIVDRIKELIKYKAFQVPPAEIEALLLTHPKIKDAAVIGKPDATAGELPFAFVVKQAGVDLTAEEVIKFVADNASPAKRLRGGVKFVGDIPKNPSGKILRRVLRESLKNPKSKL